MRDIEFRGRDEHGIWRFGSFAQKKINNLIYPCIFTYKEWDSGDYIDDRVVEGDTIGEFTGLTNYSGIKIFEGDKLKANDNFYLHQEITVKYDPESGFFPRDFVGDIRNYEVVGNIYDK